MQPACLSSFSVLGVTVWNLLVAENSTALSKVGEQPAVWLLDQQSKARLQPVRVARYASEKVVIDGGLEAGQTVVTVGGQLLHPGQVVEVAQPPQPTQNTASRDAVGGGQP